MLPHWKSFFARHEPHCGSFLVGLKSGAGGMLGIALVGGAAAFTHLPLLIAPFGARARADLLAPQADRITRSLSLSWRAIHRSNGFNLIGSRSSAVLLFGHPATPLAKPANVIGGYGVAASVGMVFAVLFPGLWWAAALGVGLAILAMLLLRVSHPPASAVPVLMVVSAADPFQLAGVVFAGSAALVALASLYHRLPPRHDYPRRPG